MSYLVNTSELSDLSEEELIDFCLRFVASGSVDPTTLNVLRMIFVEMKERGLDARAYALAGKELKEALEAAGGRGGLN